MKVFIVRHGETDLSKKGVIQGQMQSALTMDGKLQAEALALRLKQEKIARVISSPLQRALTTATIIAKQFRIEVEIDDRLMERSFGIYEGNPLSDIDRIMPGTVSDPRFRPPKGENMDDLFCRANAFLATLGKEDILILGHKHINRMLIGALLGYGPDEGLDIRQPPASLSIIECSKGKGKAILIDDISHLKNQPQEMDEVF